MSLPLDTGGGQGFTSIPKGYDGASTWIIARADCISRSKAKNRLYRLLDKSRFPGLEPTVVDGLKREFSTSMPGNNAKRQDSSASGSIHPPLPNVFSGLVSCAADAFVKFFDLGRQAGKYGSRTAATAGAIHFSSLRATHR